LAVTDTEIPNKYDYGQPSSMITGCIGLMTRKANETSIYIDKYLKYDPLGASVPYRVDDRDEYILNPPITQIDAVNFSEGDKNYNSLGFDDLAETRGTIFVYAREKGYARNTSYIPI